MNSPYNSTRSYDLKSDTKEKDILISQLKAHIFELEQHEKNYDQLNHRHRNLQNECTLLNEEKLRLEYELKQRTETFTKQVSELKSENESLQLAYNEKICVNKKMYADNNHLIHTLENRNCEINDLQRALDESMDQNAKLCEAKSNLEHKNNCQAETINNHKLENQKLTSDNVKLSKICQEQDKNIKTLECERLKHLSCVEELNYEIKSLNGKLKSREDMLSFTNKQLEESKNTSNNQHQTIVNYEKTMDAQADEIRDLHKQVDKANRQHDDCEKHNEELKKVVGEKDQEIHRYHMENDNLVCHNNRLKEEKTHALMENERLKNHIMVLTEQNQKLSLEIENVTDQDEKIRVQLARKDRTNNLLTTNKLAVEKSLATLDDFLNKVSKVNKNFDGVNNGPSHNNTGMSAFATKSTLGKTSPRLSPYSTNSQKL